MSMVHCFNLQKMFTKTYFPGKRKNQTTQSITSAYSLFFQLSLGGMQLLLHLLSMAFFLFVYWVLMTDRYALSFLNILNLCIHIQTTVYPLYHIIFVPTPDLPCFSGVQPGFFAMSVTDKQRQIQHHQIILFCPLFSAVPTEQSQWLLPETANLQDEFILNMKYIFL